MNDMKMLQGSHEDSSRTIIYETHEDYARIFCMSDMHMFYGSHDDSSWMTWTATSRFAWLVFMNDMSIRHERREFNRFMHWISIYDGSQDGSSWMTWILSGSQLSFIYWYREDSSWMTWIYRMDSTNSWMTCVSCMSHMNMFHKWHDDCAWLT